MNSNAIKHLRTFLDSHEVDEIVQLAKEAQSLEDKWQRKLEKKKAEAIDKILEALKSGDTSAKSVWESLDMEQFFLEHYLGVAQKAIQEVGKSPTLKKSKISMAKPKTKAPRKSKDIRYIWDQWRTKGKLPKSVRKSVDSIKKDYLDRTKSVWESFSEGFRQGDVVTREDLSRRVAKEFAVPFNRGKTIVQTQTTSYYNQVRVELYNESPDITHYLFVAVRDHATTKWCKDRHFLVYKKDSAILKKETPGIHWNCRSELLPLSPLNPAHRRLIEDQSKWRENHKCEPLPAGWGNG